MNLSATWLDRAARLFEQLGLRVHDLRWLVLALALALLGGGTFLAGKVMPDNSFEGYFQPDDTTYQSYLDYMDSFGSDEVTYILYRAPDRAEGPFDHGVMTKINALTQDLEAEVPFVDRVVSLTNVEFIAAEDDFIQVTELMYNFPATQADLLAIREMALSKPLYVESVINGAADHGAIIVEMSRTSTDGEERLRWDPDGGDGLDNFYPQVSYHRVAEILARPEYAGIEFYLSGDVPLNAIYNETLLRETALLPLITFALVALLSMLFFNIRLIGLVGPLLVVLASIAMTVGFIALMDWKLGLLFLMVPTLLTAIGVAQSVHLLAEFQQAEARGLARRAAIGHTLRKVGTPCLLAAVTTAAGFLAMSGSALKSISQLAVYSAVGVMFTFVFMATLLLAILAMGRKPLASSADGPVDRGLGNPLIARLLERVIAVNRRRHKLVLGIFTVLIAVSLAGAARLQVDFNFLTEFKEKIPWRQHTTYIEEVMGGILSVVYTFDTGTADGAKNPEVLARLEQLQRAAEREPLVKKSYSIVDILKDLNQAFNGGDPAYYRLPTDQNLIAQYLLMYEMSGGKELAKFMNSDFSSTPLKLRVEMTESSNLRDLLERLDTIAAANSDATVTIETTGIGLLWVQLADYIADSQLQGYSLAFVMIALIIALVFRSLKVAALAMVPNVLPVVLTLGVMGWFDIHLDYYRLLLATIAIGIAVDDTIHVLTRFRAEFRSLGNYDAAMAATLRGVGQALIISSSSLVMAFLVFLISDTTVFASFGVLLAATILSALVADLYLLPVLLTVFKPFGPEFVPARGTDAPGPDALPTHA